MKRDDFNYIGSKKTFDKKILIINSFMANLVDSCCKFVVKSF